jgi:Putative peptidoglycan binding domain
MKIGLRASCAGLAALMLMALPATAKNCKNEAISATSREYLSRSLGAFPGSWAAWRKEVKAQLGDGWQAWRRSEDRKIKCQQVGDSRRWTCTRTARPCRPGAQTPTTDPEPVYQPIDQVLKRGMSGEQVKTLQFLLKEAGFDVVIDGDFGRTTQRALVEFQKKNKLAADGRAGPKTVEALTS